MHTKSSLNQLAYEIVSCAIIVHQEMGPGLLIKISTKKACTMSYYYEDIKPRGNWKFRS